MVLCLLLSVMLAMVPVTSLPIFETRANVSATVAGSPSLLPAR
jgi:hypothetical protein